MAYYKQCHDYECQGKGIVTCFICAGEGVRGRSPDKVVCKNCNGSGKIKCEICDGKGKIEIGDVLLDATTLVSAIYLINGGRLTAPTLHCLSVLLESILLSERLVFVEPCLAETKKIFYEALSFIPKNLVKVIIAPSRRCLGWDRFKDISELVPKSSYRGMSCGKNEELNAFLEDPFHLAVEDFCKIERAISNEPLFPSDIILPSTFNQKCGLDQLGLLNFDIWNTDLDWIVDTALWSYARETAKNIGEFKSLSLARSIVYFRVMHYLNIPYRPDFYRLPLFKFACKKINAKFDDLAYQLSRKINDEEIRSREKWNELICSTHNLRLYIPISVVSALTKANTRKEILSATIDLRESSMSRDYRNGCLKLEYQLYTGENIAEAFGLLAQLENKLASKQSDSSIVHVDSIPSVAYSLVSGFDTEINLTNLTGSVAKAIYKGIKDRNIVYLDHFQKQSRKVRDLNILCKKLFSQELDAANLEEMAKIVGI